MGILNIKKIIVLKESWWKKYVDHIGEDKEYKNAKMMLAENMREHKHY